MNDDKLRAPEPTVPIVFVKDVFDNYEAYDKESGVWTCVMEGHYILIDDAGQSHPLNLKAGTEVLHLKMAVRVGKMKALNQGKK